MWNNLGTMFCVIISFIWQILDKTRHELLFQNTLFSTLEGKIHLNKWKKEQIRPSWKKNAKKSTLYVKGRLYVNDRFWQCLFHNQWLMLFFLTVSSQFGKNLNLFSFRTLLLRILFREEKVIEQSSRNSSFFTSSNYLFYVNYHSKHLFSKFQSSRMYLWKYKQELLYLKLFHLWHKFLFRTSKE